MHTSHFPTTPYIGSPQLEKGKPLQFARELSEENNSFGVNHFLTSSQNQFYSDYDSFEMG